MNVRQNVSLLPYNTFGIDVTCRYFVEVTTADELKEVLLDDELNTLPILVVGGGSNMLLTQRFDGLVIKISMHGIEKVKEDASHVWIKAAAGEVWHELVLYCIDKGYGGIENLSLIPGQVGAAPMQNIGAYGVELKEVFEQLEAMEVATGELHTFDSDACQFGYRNSVFKNELKGKYIITSVTLKLQKQPTFNTSYGAIQNTLEEMGIDELSIQNISKAVIAIRSSKLPNPKEIGNAGSFFKNPEVRPELFARIQEKYPDAPNYPLPSGKIKVPAGWLIEQCGWKGKQIGNTGAHKHQALVLVNYGGATGNEVKQLATDIQRSVKEKFGIDISPEVNII